MKSIAFALLLVLSTMAATATAATPGAAVGTFDESEASSRSSTAIDSESAHPEDTYTESMFERPVEPVIDTVESVDPNDPEIVERVRQTEAEIKAQQEADAAQTPGAEHPFRRSGTASAGGGISLLFDPATPMPPDAQAVVQAAADQWDQVLVTSPGGSTEIEVFWKFLGTGSLGYARPETMFWGGDLPSGDAYPVALANSLVGMDLNGPARAEGRVTLNADLLTNERWYIGTTGQPGPSQQDLYSVALHELGHALGFTASSFRNGNTGVVELYQVPYSYDRQTKYLGTELPLVGQLETALTSFNVQIDISDAEALDVWAPPTFSSSSHSHFDEIYYGPGDPGHLMTPFLSPAEVARTIDAGTLGVMQQIGWTIVPRPVSPTIVATFPDDTEIDIFWIRNLETTGLPPHSYKVEAFIDDTILHQVVTVPGTLGQAGLTGLYPGTNYTVRVTPVGANGNGSPDEQIVTTTGQPPTVGIVDIRPLALDSQISRLYQAYFLRLPEPSGFEYWLEQRALGLPLEAISNAFASSPEFVTQYGSLNDAQFVTLIYQNVLARQPDPDGLAYWEQALASGQSRGSVMIGFADSPEFIGRTATVAPHSSTEGSIRRLYHAAFLRPADDGGLAFWVGQKESGRTLAGIGDEFTTSPEFVNRYGSLANADFIDLVYRNVLDRQPDADGLNFWANQLNAGVSRGEVLVGFSESPEFILQTGTIP